MWGLRILLGLLLSSIAITGLSWRTAAYAHRDGCHRWHSCPSDSGAYSCGDSGYACRYPTYPESQRGLVRDPTYEDYGYTDRTPADRDYGYSDACPLGCAPNEAIDDVDTGAGGEDDSADSPTWTNPNETTSESVSQPGITGAPDEPSSRRRVETTRDVSDISSTAGQETAQRQAESSDLWLLGILAALVVIGGPGLVAVLSGRQSTGTTSSSLSPPQQATHATPTNMKWPADSTWHGHRPTTTHKRGSRTAAMTLPGECVHGIGNPAWCADCQGLP